MGTCPAGSPVYPKGVIRLTDGVAGAPPLFYAPDATSVCSADDGGKCVAAANGGYWLGQFLNAVYDARQFGAKCDGATDASAALNAAIAAAIHAHAVVSLPAATCAFASQLVGGVGSNWGIVGQGPGSSRLLYTGTATNIDLIRIGDTSYANFSNGLLLSNFMVSSTPTMTAGWAIHLYYVTNSREDNIFLDTQFSGNHHLYSGIDFDAANQNHFNGGQIYATADGVTVTSGSGSLLGADIWINHSFIGYGATGIHLAGGASGVNVDSADILSNSNGVVIDNALSATGNNQLFLGPQAEIDNSSNDGVYINETGGSGPELMFGGWIASSGNHGIEVAKCNAAGSTHCRLYLGSSGEIITTINDAVHIDTGVTLDQLYDDANIDSYGLNMSSAGYGINCVSGSTVPLVLANPPSNLFAHSGSAPVTGCANLSSSRWTNWTPTLSFSSGNSGLTYSSGGSYIIEPDGSEKASFSISLSAIGSASGAASVTNLPFTCGSVINGALGTTSYAVNFQALTSPIYPTTGLNSAAITFYQWGATGVNTVGAGNFTNTSVMEGWIECKP